MACMLIYYMLAGSIADVALLMNILFILAIMAGVRATFTLPGIAGIILTIGMSVDANVLIFERIREEQQKGSSLRIAITNGYQKAFICCPGDLSKTIYLCSASYTNRT
jgi:protein-export membrane protein SecD